MYLSSPNLLSREPSITLIQLYLLSALWMEPIPLASRLEVARACPIGLTSLAIVVLLSPGLATIVTFTIRRRFNFGLPASPYIIQMSK